MEDHPASDGKPMLSRKFKRAQIFASIKSAEISIKQYYAAGFNGLLRPENLFTEFINQDATLYTQPELPLAHNEDEVDDGRNKGGRTYGGPAQQAFYKSGISKYGDYDYCPTR